MQPSRDGNTHKKQALPRFIWTRQGFSMVFIGGLKGNTWSCLSPRTRRIHKEDIIGEVSHFHARIMSNIWMQNGKFTKNNVSWTVEEAFYNQCLTLYLDTSNACWFATHVIEHYHGVDLDYTSTDNNMKTGQYGKLKCAKA